MAKKACLDASGAYDKPGHTTQVPAGGREEVADGMWQVAAGGRQEVAGSPGAKVPSLITRCASVSHSRYPGGKTVSYSYIQLHTLLGATYTLINVFFSIDL